MFAIYKGAQENHESTEVPNNKGQKDGNLQIQRFQTFDFFPGSKSSLLLRNRL